MFLDGDYADPPADLPRILAPLLRGEADLVLGCRDLSVAPDALPVHARVRQRCPVGGAGWLLPGSTLVDLPSFKAIRADSLHLLTMQEMSYGWTVEMLVKAVRAEDRIAQIQVAYRPRLGGQSKVSGTLRGTLGAAWKLVTCMVRYAAWRPRSILPARDDHVSQRGVVYVVAKAPRPGACKTRLCPPLTSTQAARLAGAFLADALTVVVAAGLTPRVVCRDVEEQTFLNALVGDVAEVRVQAGTGLGAALERRLQRGARGWLRRRGRAGCRQSDAGPDGPATRLPGAGHRRQHSIQGPAKNGGYYLLAACAVHPRLFRDMVWSTSRVAAETLHRCRAQGLGSPSCPPGTTWTRLCPWSDCARTCGCSR